MFSVFIPGRGALTSNRGLDTKGPWAVWKTRRYADAALQAVQDTPASRMPRNVEAYKAGAVLPVAEVEALCYQLDKERTDTDNRCRALRGAVDGAAQAARMAPFVFEKAGVSRTITKEEADAAFTEAKKALTDAIANEPLVAAWFANG